MLELPHRLIHLQRQGEYSAHSTVHFNGRNECGEGPQQYRQVALCSAKRLGNLCIDHLSSSSQNPNPQSCRITTHPVLWGIKELGHAELAGVQAGMVLLDACAHVTWSREC